MVISEGVEGKAILLPTSFILDKNTGIIFPGSFSGKKAVLLIFLHEAFRFFTRTNIDNSSYQSSLCNQKPMSMKKLLLLTSALFLVVIMGSGQTLSAISNKQVLKNTKTSASTGLTQKEAHPFHLTKPVTQVTSQEVDPVWGNNPKAWAQPWYFTQTYAYYTAISGGTVLGTTANDEQTFGPFNIGFTFTYNGTAYTQFSVATNGFIGLGGTVVTTATLPISGGTSNNIASALGVDLQGQTGSTLQYLTIGTTPNRTLVVQWSNYRKKNATGESLSFQIRLSENNNSVSFVYNTFTVVGTTATAQVGIRGASSADYNNRLVNATYSTWDASGAGTANTSNCRLRATIFPADSLTYSWTPVVTASATLPLTENFDELQFGTMPKGWSVENTNSDAYFWTPGYVYPNSDPQGMYIVYNSSVTMNDWFFSPKLTLTAGHTYKVSFYYSATPSSPVYPEKLEVKYGSTATGTGMTSTAIFSNTNITNTTYTQGTGTISPSSTGDYYVGWHGFSIANEYILFVDDISITEVFAHDVAPVALMNPTSIPASQQMPWFGKVQNLGSSTESFTVSTKLRENTVLSSTQTNSITSLTANSTSSLSGNFNLSALGAASTFDLALQTNLSGDQNTSNDILTNYTRSCKKDTIYAWDDGSSEGSVGFNTGSGWLGQLYYLSAQDTLTSIVIQWGTIVGTIAGNSLEIYNVAGGVPTTKFSDIVTGISLTTTDALQLRTYRPSSPIILPAGTYWIGAHQTTALAGTFLVSNDQTGLTMSNYLPGFAFFSTDGTAWNDYTASSLPMINIIRPNFATIIVPFVENPTALTATPVSSSEIDLSWVLNSHNNNVLVAWSSTGTFGTPVNGTTYSSGATIPGGGTVLQYNNLTSFHHTGLSANTIYYYKIWSYSGTIYSGGVLANATTFCNPSPAPWTENFEATTFPPTCWTAYSGGGAWARSTAASGYGTGSASALAAFFGYTSSSPFTLVTLGYTNGSLINPRLSFDYAYATSSYDSGDELDILYSKDNGATWYYLYFMYGGTSGELNTGGTIETEFVPTAAQWKTKILSLPAGTNKIAFMAISGYGNDLYLDNVKTIESVAHDVALESVDAPTANTVGGTIVTPKATVVNQGSNTETFTVTMTITGGYSSTKTVTALAPGLTHQVTFDTWTPALGQYTVNVCTSLSGDLETSNDCQTIPAGVYTGAWTGGTDYPTNTYFGGGVGWVDHSGPSPVGYLYSIGGNTESGLGTECYKYNCTTNTWTAIASLPAGRRVFATAVVGNYIYVIGGSDMSSVFQSTVYKYDIAGNSWSTVASLPVATAFGKAVGYGSNYIYFAGGVDGSDNSLATVYLYNISGNSWTSATSMPGDKYAGAFSISDNYLVYVAGANSTGITNTVYVGTINPSVPATIAWASKSPYPAAPTASQQLVNVPLNSQFKPEGKGQTSVPGVRAAAYPAGTMFRFDGAPWGTDGVIVAGGSAGSGWYAAYPNPCYLYKPAVDTWTKEPDVEWPVTAASLGSVNLSAGSSHTWKLILAGGLDVFGAVTDTVQILTDDVTEPLAHDVGVTTINANQAINLGVTPTATVRNFGTNTETFDVTMTIGAYTSTKTVTSLASTMATVVTFDPWSSTVGDYSISVCTSLSGDLNTSNDCMTQGVKVLDLNMTVYGYIAYQDPQTDSIGPCTFNMSTPGTLTNLEPQGAQNFVSSGTWANGKWYGTVYNTATPYNFITIDPVTGARTVIGDMGFNMNGLSYNVADATMYGVGTSGSDSQLYTINMTTGAATLVSTIPSMLLINLAIDNSGNCYSVDLNAEKLVKIDLPAGTYSVVGSIGFNAAYAQDMEFDRNTGNLYMATLDGTNGWLAWVNTTTGATLKIGNFEGDAEITGFAIPYTSDKALNLSSLFVEGLYAGENVIRQTYNCDGLQYQADTADMVTVELHLGDYATIEYTTQAALMIDGSATASIPSGYNGSYYLTIRSRNNLETTSANPVDFSGSIINYAFDVTSQAYGDNMQTATDGTPVLYSGDITQDGLVDSDDLAAIGNLAAWAECGYLPEDLTGDGLIDSDDLAICGNNAAWAVGAILPY
jgi:hypothetical protein